MNKVTYDYLMESEGFRDTLTFCNIVDDYEESEAPNGDKWTSENLLCLDEYPFEEGHYYSVSDQSWDYGFEYYEPNDREEKWCATNVKNLVEVIDGERWPHVNVGATIYKYLGNGEFKVLDAYENTFEDKYGARFYAIDDEEGPFQVTDEWED